MSLIIPSKKTVKDLRDMGSKIPIADPFLNVTLVSATPEPQKLFYRAMHQDYSAEQIVKIGDDITEERAGEICVERLLKGERGHYGCLERGEITFSTGFFPHSVMQQARTHRISVSFDVQSYRYTSQTVLDAATESFDAASVEKAFYLRPVGFYTDRNGKKYEYPMGRRMMHLRRCWRAAIEYKDDIEFGMSEEHARGLIPFDYRQHFYVTFNLRSALHFLDLRSKADAQLEIRILAEMIALHIAEWCPQIWEYYEANRFRKAKLAP